MPSGSSTELLSNGPSESEGLKAEVGAMSQRTVGIVINRLVTEEDLRVRFALDRIETLAELSLRGFELTPDEIDVFIRTDARVWSWESEQVVARVH
jgi:hypothetical protein